MKPDPALLRPAHPSHLSTSAEISARIDELCDTARAIVAHDASRAHQLASEALDLARTLPDPTRQRRALLQHGAACLYSGQLHAARDSLNEGLALARAARDGDGQLRALINLALAAHGLGQFGEALERLHEALGVARSAGDPQREFNCLLNIGAVHSEVGEHEQALEAFERAGQVGADLDDPTGQAMVLCNIADVRVEMGEHALAYDAYTEALAVYRRHADPYSELSALVSLGFISLSLQRPSESRTWNEDALVLARTVANPYMECRALQGLGSVALTERDLDRALATLDEALVLATQHGFLQNQIQIMGGLADVFVAEGDVVTARETLDRALDLALGADMKRETYELHAQLAQVCAGIGEFEWAYRHHRAFHAGEAEMRRRQNERRVATLLVRLDVQRTRQAAELERLRNEELAQANAALVALDEEKNALLDRLREQAQRDALTGLYNRRVLNDRLHEQARTARVRGAPLGVVLLDVDRFKHVNDAFSHGVGDEVLRQLAALLVGTCRSQDTIARYGGEEFALLLPDADHATCLRVAERVRSVVEGHDWSTLRPGLHVTISAGVHAEVGPTEPERMLAVADARLYAAKDGGRNRVSGDPAVR